MEIAGLISFATSLRLTSFTEGYPGIGLRVAASAHLALSLGVRRPARARSSASPKSSSSAVCAPPVSRPGSASSAPGLPRRSVGVGRARRARHWRRSYALLEEHGERIVRSEDLLIARLASEEELHWLGMPRTAVGLRPSPSASCFTIAQGDRAHAERAGRDPSTSSGSPCSVAGAPKRSTPAGTRATGEIGSAMRSPYRGHPGCHATLDAEVALRSRRTICRSLARPRRRAGTPSSSPTASAIRRSRTASIPTRPTATASSSRTSPSSSPSR